MEILFALLIGFLLGANVVLGWINVIPRLHAFAFAVILALLFFCMGDILALLGVQ